ncbi:MAG: alpha/beta fold hydrolase, partial [Gammaproteobacteria bacterium]
MANPTWTEKKVGSDRHETAFLEAGPQDGTAIILVHGWPELSISWRHQIPFLAELGYRVVAPDMRGYGNSSTYDTHAAYAQREVVADMLELADALDIDRAIWIGH